LSELAGGIVSAKNIPTKRNRG